MVAAAPPPPAGILESSLPGSPYLFGLVALSDRVGQPPASLLPLVSPLVGYTGVENASVGFHGGAGMAELADPVRERIVCSHAGDDDLGPGGGRHQVLDW
jgi:hypothetical protein